MMKDSDNSKGQSLMDTHSASQLTPLQQTLLTVVENYPGRFSRSGLAQMLVGAKSWQETDLPEYGRFSDYRRKEVGFQVEILLQQGYLALDGRERLILAV
jgi:hypothetical protein